MSVNESKTPSIIAVIDIGSSAIRMMIAETNQSAGVRILENLQKPVRFGKDVFSKNQLSRKVMNEGIQILSDYRQICNTYGVSRLQAVATSAIRDATNRDSFIDRVFVRTGIDVELLEGPEQNRLELIAVQQALKNKIDLTQKNCLILEVGSGSTEMIILNKGEVEVTRTLSIGSMRLPEQMDVSQIEADTLQKVLKRNVKQITAYVAKEYNLEQIDMFISIGSDMRFACRQLSEPADDTFGIIDKKKFINLLGKISKVSSDEVSKQYGIPYADAQSLYPTLLYNYNFLQATRVENIVVPMTSIRDGVLTEMAQLISGQKKTDVSKQVLNSVRHLAEKYEYDKAHAQCVSSLSMKLFDLLQKDHGMSSRERLLLEVSAILHDIGAYISPSGHHRHSSYIIDSSEIFGLRKSDCNVVSNVVRYHRKTGPKQSHVAYMSLPKFERANVSKMAAILRVADALDQSHQQKIKQFTLEQTDKAYTIWVEHDAGDISSERKSVEEKGRFFADTYGLPIILRRKVLR